MPGTTLGESTQTTLFVVVQIWSDSYRIDDGDCQSRFKPRTSRIVLSSGAASSSISIPVNSNTCVSSCQGTIRPISSKNCSLRVLFVYFSNPVRLLWRMKYCSSWISFLLSLRGGINQRILKHVPICFKIANNVIKFAWYGQMMGIMHNLKLWCNRYLKFLWTVATDYYFLCKYLSINDHI